MSPRDVYRLTRPGVHGGMSVVAMTARAEVAGRSFLGSFPVLTGLKSEYLGLTSLNSAYPSLSGANRSDSEGALR